MNVYTKKQTFFGQKFFIKFGVLIILVVSLNIFNSQVRNFFYLASYPINTMFLQSGNSASSFFGGFFNVKNTREENISLKHENLNLLAKIALLENKLNEERDLSLALESTKDDNFKIILARVVGLNIGNDTIVIDKGLDDGISENMPIISSQKVVYGKVATVYKNFSQVLLISAQHSATNVKISQSSLDNAPLAESEQTDASKKIAAYGVLRGRGGLSAFLDLVDLESEIIEGDNLVTSGLEGIYPKNLLVGQITSVLKSDVKPFQTAEVKLFSNFKSIENLFIITNYNK